MCATPCWQPWEGTSRCQEQGGREHLRSWSTGLSLLSISDSLEQVLSLAGCLGIKVTAQAV